MATKFRYQVKLHKLVSVEDIPFLPNQLRKDLTQYQQILSLDPYQTRGVPSHSLTGKLDGCRTLEIDWNGISYRLVYRIFEKPAPKRVEVLSFAEHDPAYERAKARK